jgi:hypothetical protein
MTSRPCTTTLYRKGEPISTNKQAVRQVLQPHVSEYGDVIDMHELGILLYDRSWYSILQHWKNRTSDIIYLCTMDPT